MARVAGVQPQKIAPAISAPRAPRPINRRYRPSQSPTPWALCCGLFRQKRRPGRYHLEKKAEGRARQIAAGTKNLTGKSGSFDPILGIGRTRPAAAAKFGVSEASVQAEIGWPKAPPRPPWRRIASWLSQPHARLVAIRERHAGGLEGQNPIGGWPLRANSGHCPSAQRTG